MIKEITFPVKKLYWNGREILREFLRNSFVDRATPCQVRRLRLNVSVSSAIEAFRAGTYATKEPETLDWIDTELADNEILFDIGANIGLYSMYAAKAHPGLKVYAFEPESLNFSRLLRNLFINGLTEAVTPLNVAIAGKTELGFLLLSQLQAGAALHGIGKKTETSIREGVFCSTLDDLCSKFGLPQPHHIKIDVDGLEDRIILGGASKTLNSPQLKTLLLEVSETDVKLQPIHDFIIGCGLECVKAIVVEEKSRTTNRLYKRK